MSQLNEKKKTEDRLGRYAFAAIEAKWQAYWSDHETFKVPNPGDDGADMGRPKYYVLDMFPYPSGSGLHVGHPLGYCATDIVARYKRMRGFNVLHPIGFDAFGLPAEQYAVETNVHPAITTKKNIERYRQQLKMFGFSYDWSREIATCEPAYYKWTQWAFTRMFNSFYDDQCAWQSPDGKEIVGKARPISELVAELETNRWGVNDALEIVRDGADVHRLAWSSLSAEQQRRVLAGQRLAFIGEIAVNWCPALGTVLANEEVDNEGRSERGNHPVYRRPLRQWMLRITKYAERLIDDLEGLDWPEPIKIMQRNWVGRSTGAEVVFPLADHWQIVDGQWMRKDATASQPLSLSYCPHAIKVYTTRPDTLFGATYMVLAPEHPLVDEITTPACRADVDRYVESARRKSDMARTTEVKEKTGVFTGTYAINPVNGEHIEIWIADYVLMGYGTGAIMAVPGGDTRDFAFAVAFDLPIRSVVKPTTSWIEEHVAAMTADMGVEALAGMDRVAQEIPELAEVLSQRRDQVGQLGDKTIAILRDKVGLERLADHATKYPKAWGEPFTGEGVAVNSSTQGLSADWPGGSCSLDGLVSSEAKEAITAWLESAGLGRATVNYKLRDWLFSRQRYWGEPFPVLHDEHGVTMTVDDSELPVELPDMEDFRPTAAQDNVDSVPEPPLTRVPDWVQVDREGRHYQRDVNTMPQWAGSCWYFLRYLDPHNSERFCDAKAEQYWMPVDLYVGGAEHAVLHLLYARFWHKVLYDLGQVSTREPFQKLYNQGMIQGFAYRGKRGLMVGPEEVEQQGDDTYTLKTTGEPVSRVIAKMSKSLKNVVNPDGIVEEFGTDTFRLYEMYMGPLDAAKPWNTRDVPGLHKLCQRIWRLVVDEWTGDLSASLTDQTPGVDAKRMLHKLVKRVTTELEQLKFNTAIAAIFDFVNQTTAMKEKPREIMEPFVLVISPFAPHLAEELWHRLGHETTLAYEPWPEYDEKLAQDEQLEIAVQVSGKIKAKFMIAADADAQAIESAALADESVKSALVGKTVRKVIVVKGRLVNIVAN